MKNFKLVLPAALLLITSAFYSFESKAVMQEIPQDLLEEGGGGGGGGGTGGGGTGGGAVECPLGQADTDGDGKCDYGVVHEDEHTNNTGFDKDAVINSVNLQPEFFEEQQKRALGTLNSLNPDQTPNSDIRAGSNQNPDQKVQELTGLNSDELQQKQLEQLKKSSPELFDSSGNMDGQKVKEFIDSKIKYYATKNTNSPCPAGQEDPDGDGFCELIKTACPEGQTDTNADGICEEAVVDPNGGGPGGGGIGTIPIDPVPAVQ